MKKTYVLNKPALLTSEEPLLRFDGNDIVIPIAVLEDLQASLPNLKSSRRAIARKVLDYLDSFDFKLLSTEGAKLQNGTILRVTVNYTDVEVVVEGVSQKDRRILQTCKGLQLNGENVVLISNNPVTRMKARQIGIVAEELRDMVFPSLESQYTGYADVFCSATNISQMYDKGFMDPLSIYKHDKVDWKTNLYLNIKGEGSSSALAYYDGDKIIPIGANQNPYGIKPKNVRQKFLIHALMDPDTPLVIVKGNAGTGKTFCSLAAGLEQTVHSDIYNQILITKSTKSVDQEELGFLPGDIKEKVDPYIRGIQDNLEELSGDRGDEKRGKLSDYYFMNGTIDIQTLGHLRGRTISRTYYIIDEAQNMTPEATKQIATRAGMNSKFIFLGDPSQIDSPELTEKYNGLVYLSEMMKGKSLCRQITFDKVEDVIRSPLAQLAVDVLL